jgi:SWI/SNF-related matrix-associated actin-dependent regulator 1 of chromatin subfamily A
MPVLSRLRPYQQEGIDWLVASLKRYRAVLLADEAGLGKTLEALVASRRLAMRRVLIVCPAGARRVWQLEIVKWFPGLEPWTWVIEPGTTVDPKEWQNPLRPANLIVGYDELSNKASPIRAQLERSIKWDLLVLDECHYLKNPSNRTQAVYGKGGTGKGLQTRAAKVILLSGTPTPNHAGELYEHVRTFWHDALAGNGSRVAFEDAYTRYKDTVFGRQVVGSKNQAKLRDKLQDVVLRRRKAEVLTELPPLVLQDIPLSDASAGAGFNATGLTQLENFFKHNSPSDDDVIRILQTPDIYVTSLRQHLGIAKARPAIEWIRERLASTEKMLVFAWHHSVIDLLRRGLLEFEPAVITGETSPKARTEAIANFQHRSANRVFIGQVLAAGTAITLTAANEVAIVEPSWVPGENVQAICRAHRLGQRDSVLASFLYLPGTLDERIMGVFRRKASEIGQLQGDRDDNPHLHTRSADATRARPAGATAAGVAAGRH